MRRAAGRAPVDPLRRAAVAGAIGTGIGVALASAGKGCAAAPLAKLDKTAVRYTDAGTVKDQDCDDCVHFLPGSAAGAPGTCRIVEGAISPHGHCIAFSPKPRT